MKKIDYLKRVIVFDSKYKSNILLILFIKAALILLEICNPYFYKVFIKDVLTEHNISMLFFVIGGYISIYVLIYLFSYLYKRVSCNIIIEINKKIKHKLFTNCFSLKKEDSNKIADLKNIIENDIEAISPLLTNYTIDYYYQWIYAVILFFVMLFINWKLTLISVAMVPISFLFTKFMVKKAKAISDKYRNLFSHYEDFLRNELNNYKEVKSNCLQEKMISIFEDYWLKLGKLFVKQQVLWFSNRTFVSIKDFFIVKMNIYFIGGLFLIRGSLDIASLLIFMNYFDTFFNTVSVIIEQKVQFPAEQTKLDKILSLLDKTEELQNHIYKNYTNINIDLKEISFKYPTDNNYVLNNISESFLPNTITAIVGKTGCGKSTLLSLITRLYVPSSGKILWNGDDISLIPENQFYKNVNFVFQYPYFFNKSIRYNMQLVKPNITDEEIYSALETVNMKEFVCSLPEKLDTPMGENGIKFSGGQRQRFAISRALIKGGEVFVFDEVTSALDNENENIINGILKELRKDKTIIMVSHRLSSFNYADKIIFLKDGEVFASGPGKKLLRENTELKKLINKQRNTKEVAE